MFLEEFYAKFTRFSHRFIPSAVKRIKEYLLTNDVVCSVETQLLRQVGCGDFQLAVCGLDLVIDSRDVVKVEGDMGVGLKQVNDVHSIFRIAEDAISWRTPKQLSEVLNRRWLLDFSYSSGFRFFLSRLTRLACLVCLL